MDKSEFVEHKFEELQKLLDLVDVVEQIELQFPDDMVIAQEADKARVKRTVCIHNVFVDILGEFGERVSRELVDLMEQNFRHNDDSSEVDRKVELYFGKQERKKRKTIKIKRRKSK